MNINKKAMEIGINMVVMVIIGIVIFGLGMGLFGKIAGSSEDQVADLRGQIKSNIASLECDGENWICAPSYKLNSGDSGNFNIFVANKDDQTEDFSISIDGDVVENGNGVKINKDGCGTIKIVYFEDTIPLESGYSQNFPIKVYTNEVLKTCSFLTTVTLNSDESTGNGETTILNVRVEN